MVAIQRDAPISVGLVDDAVTAVHRAHYVTLIRFAALVLGDLAEAEDVVQEAFLRSRAVWIRDGVPDVPVAYLRRSVANLCNSRLRRLTTGLRLLRPAAQDGASAEHEALLRDDQRTVIDALDRLPRQQRTACASATTWT